MIERGGDFLVPKKENNYEMNHHFSYCHTMPMYELNSYCRCCSTGYNQIRAKKMRVHKTSTSNSLTLNGNLQGV